MNKTAYALIGLLGVLAVILTATAISAVSHSQELTAQLEQAQTELQNSQGKPAGKTTTGSNEMLQKLLAEETAVNAELRKEIERLENSAAAAPVANGRVGAAVETNSLTVGRATGPAAWMERIRQQDPERYKQIVADREQRRKETDDWYANTQSQLAARAQAAATPDEADLANQIADTLAKLNDLRQQQQQLQVANLPTDPQLQAEIQNTRQQLSQLSEQDRTLQYQQLATQLGLTGDKAQTLVTTIPQILQATKFTPPRGGPSGTSGATTTPPITPVPTK